MSDQSPEVVDLLLSDEETRTEEIPSLVPSVIHLDRGSVENLVNSSVSRKRSAQNDTSEEGTNRSSFSPLPTLTPLPNRITPLASSSDTRYYGQTYKLVPNTPNFVVDGFNSPYKSRYHFLSHFHADHYTTLGKKFSTGQPAGAKIYCSSTTARLVHLKLRVPLDVIRVIPTSQPVWIGGVRVCAIDANHCPGAVIFLFEVPFNLQGASNITSYVSIDVNSPDSKSGKFSTRMKRKAVAMPDTLLFPPAVPCMALESAQLRLKQQNFFKKPETSTDSSAPTVSFEDLSLPLSPPKPSKAKRKSPRSSKSPLKRKNMESFVDISFESEPSRPTSTPKCLQDYEEFFDFPASFPSLHKDGQPYPLFVCKCFGCKQVDGRSWNLSFRDSSSPSTNPSQQVDYKRERFLFQYVHLHTGDFRFHPMMALSPYLRPYISSLRYPSLADDGDIHLLPLNGESKSTERLKATGSRNSASYDGDDYADFHSSPVSISGGPMRESLLGTSNVLFVPHDTTSSSSLGNMPPFELPGLPTRMNSLLLDTTYCASEYAFPSQSAILSAARLIFSKLRQFDSMGQHENRSGSIEDKKGKQRNGSVLLLVGSYSIGKERMWLEAARTLGERVWVSDSRYRVLKLLDFHNSLWNSEIEQSGDHVVRRSNLKHDLSKSKEKEEQKMRQWLDFDPFVTPSPIDDVITRDPLAARIRVVPMSYLNMQVLSEEWNRIRQNISPHSKRSSSGVVSTPVKEVNAGVSAGSVSSLNLNSSKVKAPSKADLERIVKRGRRFMRTDLISKSMKDSAKFSSISTISGTQSRSSARAQLTDEGLIGDDDDTDGLNERNKEDIALRGLKPALRRRARARGTAFAQLMHASEQAKVSSSPAIPEAGLVIPRIALNTDLNVDLRSSEYLEKKKLEERRNVLNGLIAAPLAAPIVEAALRVDPDSLDGTLDDQLTPVEIEDETENYAADLLKDQGEIVDSGSNQFFGVQKRIPASSGSMDCSVEMARTMEVDFSLEKLGLGYYPSRAKLSDSNLKRNAGGGRDLVHLEYTSQSDVSNVDNLVDVHDDETQRVENDEEEDDPEKFVYFTGIVAIKPTGWTHVSGKRGIGWTSSSKSRENNENSTDSTSGSATKKPKKESTVGPLDSFFLKVKGLFSSSSKEGAKKEPQDVIDLCEDEDPVPIVSEGPAKAWNSPPTPGPLDFTFMDFVKGDDNTPLVHEDSVGGEGYIVDDDMITESNTYFGSMSSFDAFSQSQVIRTLPTFSETEEAAELEEFKILQALQGNSIQIRKSLNSFGKLCFKAIYSGVAESRRPGSRVIKVLDSDSNEFSDFKRREYGSANYSFVSKVLMPILRLDSGIRRQPSVVDIVVQEQRKGTESFIQFCNDNQKPVSKPEGLTIISIPYSEHSSFSELRMCCNIFDPLHIVPTVNNYRAEQTRRMVHELTR